MSRTIRIVVADDHPIFRKGLKEVIADDPSLAIVGEADDGDAALAAIADLRPDIAVLDIDMPRRDGFDIMRGIRDQRLTTAVIFLTMHQSEVFLTTALDTGAKGYVLKDSAVTEIVASIKAVYAGQPYISPAMSGFLVARRRRGEALADAAPGLDALTPTERKVLRLLAEFKTSKDIADILCISPRTVDHHRANIAAKLDLRGSHALTRFAVAHQSLLVEP